MNSIKSLCHLQPEPGWRGLRGARAGRTVRGGNGFRRLCVGITAVAVGVFGSPMAGPAIASGRVAEVQSAATGSSVQQLISGFGCNTPSMIWQVHCLGEITSHIASNGRVAPDVSSGPVGYGPSDLRSAYALAGTSGHGRTVALIDAMDDPKAESDLAVFRKTYGLPPCTTANGCLKKVNQDGKAAPLPAGDPGWAEEESLDLDVVSAVCPTCHIVLVEASSADVSSLTTAENAAAAIPGVVAISNSWGYTEDSSTLAADSAFRHPGIAITAGSGDAGYWGYGGVLWPASAPYVTAVGGTSLSRSATARGWTESAWSGSGSGCSANQPKPSWQHDSGCGQRTVADVSAVADPNTGIGVYDTYNNCSDLVTCDTQIQAGLAQGLDGWAKVGGTSASSPLIASVYALAGNTGSIVYSSYPYSHQSSLNDVTSGATGACVPFYLCTVNSGSTGLCSPSYLCTAGPGYDGPTGLGTPRGTRAF